eukprot:gene6774-8402_t
MDIKENTVTISVSRTFNATIEQLWRFWSDSEYLKKFWGCEIFTVPIANLDFKVGGVSFVGMTNPDAGTYYSNLQYKVIVPQERIEYLFNFADSNGNNLGSVVPGVPVDQLTIIDFKPMSSTITEITITQTLIEGSPMIDQTKSAINQQFNKIEKNI